MTPRRAKCIARHWLHPGTARLPSPTALGALRFIEGDRPDVIVLDLNLPNVGGHDVYEEMRAHPETYDIPVVIVTGSDARDLEPNDFRFFSASRSRPKR